MMNSGIIALLVVVAVLAARRRTVPPISGPRFYAIFALIVLMHVTVIGGLMALQYWKHN
jgi:hypothetical protein